MQGVMTEEQRQKLREETPENGGDSGEHDEHH
jgi:hypothetical protein